MQINRFHSMVPLERYRSIVGVLSSEKDAWDDTFWLRFAAQAAVLCPDPSLLLAQRIREIADVLFRTAAWYQTLASPARFVVAALLLQHDIPATDFIAARTRMSGLMDEVDLRHAGFPEIMTILILLLGNRSLGTGEIERLKEMYGQMKRFHWWLTGPEDLPACAALLECQGSPELVASHVEAAYRQLHDAGIPIGERLQTAANLLPLAGPGIDQTVARYCRLAAVLSDRIGMFTEAYHDPVALLTLLDHAPDLVIGHFAAVMSELDLFQPEEQGASNILIASDLTFLDLVRCDSNRTPHVQPQAVECIQRTLHALHLAYIVLVRQIKPNMIHVIHSSATPQWPYL